MTLRADGQFNKQAPISSEMLDLAQQDNNTALVHARQLTSSNVPKIPLTN
jgi:hypothetical protein